MDTNEEERVKVPYNGNMILPTLRICVVAVVNISGYNFYYTVYIYSWLSKLLFIWALIKFELLIAG